jgi:hypothetical protein
MNGRKHGLDAGDDVPFIEPSDSGTCLSIKEQALRAITSQLNFKNGSIYPSSDAFDGESSSSSDSGAEAANGSINDSDSSSERLIDIQDFPHGGLIVTNDGERGAKTKTSLDVNRISRGELKGQVPHSNGLTRNAASLKHPRHEQHQIHHDRNKARSFSVGHSHTTSSKDSTLTTTTTTTHKHNHALDFESEESKSVEQRGRGVSVTKDPESSDGEIEEARGGLGCLPPSTPGGSIAMNVIANALEKPSNVLLEMLPKRSNSVFEPTTTTTTIVSSAKVHFVPENLAISQITEPSIKHLESTYKLLIEYLNDRHVSKKRFYLFLVGIAVILSGFVLFGRGSFSSLNFSAGTTFHCIFFVWSLGLFMILLTEFANRFERTAIKGILEELLVILSYTSKNTASIVH